MQMQCSARVAQTLGLLVPCREHDRIFGLLLRSFGPFDRQCVRYTMVESIAARVQQVSMTPPFVLNTQSASCIFVFFSYLSSRAMICGKKKVRHLLLLFHISWLI
jgi:hypothetical protein